MQTLPTELCTRKMTMTTTTSNSCRSQRTRIGGWAIAPRDVFRHEWPVLHLLLMQHPLYTSAVYQHTHARPLSNYLQLPAPPLIFPALLPPHNDLSFSVPMPPPTHLPHRSPPPAAPPRTTCTPTTPPHTHTTHQLLSPLLLELVRHYAPVPMVDCHYGHQRAAGDFQILLQRPRQRLHI